MNLRGRLKHLGQQVYAVPAIDRRWDRVWNERKADLEELLAAIPESHHDPVEAALPMIVDRLLVVGPSWSDEADPAFVKWVLLRAGWGKDHPVNRTRLDTVPAALLDLLFAYPGAEINYYGCQGCGVPLPQVPASGQLGVPYRAGGPYVKPRCLADTCPVCGVDIPYRLC